MTVSVTDHGRLVSTTKGDLDAHRKQIDDMQLALHDAGCVLDGLSHGDMPEPFVLAVARLAASALLAQAEGPSDEAACFAMQLCRQLNEADAKNEEARKGRARQPEDAA